MKANEQFIYAFNLPGTVIKLVNILLDKHAFNQERLDWVTAAAKVTNFFYPKVMIAR